uniref:Succinate dehydrogenase assembly factor 3 n=1 Tax=Schistosoma japonicum TaxID=6182 RepID=C1LJ66_SCHJA|nr:ACN9 protein homolog, mitochondrial precursor (Liver regeneration-related protein LRRGT00092) [Schistosoma japonicum]
MSLEGLTNAAHSQRVRFLYKFILTLHRSLPPHLREIGDKYVKGEFKRHRDVKPEFVQPFMVEWTKYAVELSMQIKQSLQISSNKIDVRTDNDKNKVREETFGKSLDESSLNRFSEAQLNQLLTLAKEIYNEDHKLSKS